MEVALQNNYKATANGLYAVRRVSAKVQAELLWPPATSKHNFLLSLQRQHASLAPEKEPLLFVQLTWTFVLIRQPAQSGKSLQFYSIILYRRHVRTTQFYDCLPATDAGHLFEFLTHTRNCNKTAFWRRCMTHWHSLLFLTVSII